MAKSNKPLIWFPFAAGGTVIAFFIPVIALLTLMVAIGVIPPGLAYEKLHAFATNGLVKIVIFGVVALSLWSSAHRLRCTFYDFGFRADTLIATVLYLIAAAGNVALIVYLLRIV
jgi:fumarate reductase subunit D